MDWWDWRNPDFTLTFVGAVGGIIGAVVAVAIPIFLFLAARKGEAFAQKALDEQRRILARQRRDQLLATLPELTDRRTFRVLSAEVHDYSGDDHRLLLRAVRVNPLSPLPTVRVSTDEAEDFVESLPVRYARREGWEPFPELAPFLRACGPEVTSHLSARIINVLTGPAAVEQRPSHTYYRELVARGAWFLAPSLLYSLERIPSREQGGLKLNLLTGVVLGLKDLELVRPDPHSVVLPENADDFRRRVQVALGHLLHRRNLSSLDTWSLEGSTEPVSATVAWLMRAAGAGCGLDGHADQRIVENLADCVASIPVGERGWGLDEEDVVFALSRFRRQWPALWSRHGPRLEAVTKVRLPGTP